MPLRPSRAVRKPALPPLAEDSLALALSIAGEIVAGVINGRSLNDGLAGVWRTYPELSAAQRGAIMDLSYGCLRDYGRASLVLSRLLQQPLTETHTDGLLRVTLHRLETRPDQAHTTVDQAVEAAARIAGGGLKGLVNGVLRNALRQKDSLALTIKADSEASLRHPKWWIERIRKTWPREWASILEANNQHPPMSLRVNRRRATQREVIEALAEAGHPTRPLGEWGLRLEKPAPVAALPGFNEGLFSVQDWGAQQAAPLLDVADGMKVLDACSAPGGKAAHILEIADCSLTALDSDPLRLERVRTNLDRLGLAAQLQSLDARRIADRWRGERFDRILADVPCSASGVVRRHPDIKWLRRADDIGSFATVQAEILEALWSVLAPGGKMLYVTCSLFSEENSLQIARFAARHGDCTRVPLHGALERMLLPDADHDGFFLSLLQKNT
ncbi:16S rRNA (cytosine(967)-C(5))-methyltransferase RsmB [Niveibacterium terrae]|uniref:16S rRNA (cytosine(967)-C(5))-methyltransferase RsmB n=1 Tax=Niveibacterium terrae TaxID=3373598 RepID=UPI003A8CA8F4